jgi:hypothetical protein
VEKESKKVGKETGKKANCCLVQWTPSFRFFFGLLFFGRSLWEAQNETLGALRRKLERCFFANVGGKVLSIKKNAFGISLKRLFGRKKVNFVLLVTKKSKLCNK